MHIIEYCRTQKKIQAANGSCMHRRRIHFQLRIPTCLNSLVLICKDGSLVFQKYSVGLMNFKHFLDLRKIEILKEIQKKTLDPSFIPKPKSSFW